MADHKYVRFEEWMGEATDKTKTWGVYNKRKVATLLGKIKWSAPWRQYCFDPADDRTFSRSCLQHIAEFIEERMAERKEERG